MSIKQNLEQIKSDIPSHVKLVAVSKQQPISSIQQAYDQGQRVFGENRHKELIDKHTTLPNDIEWHFIGSLQRSNVKHVVPYVSMIHSVDSDKLLDEINRIAAKQGKVIDVLFEVHLAQEETKSGWDSDSLIKYIASKQDRAYAYIRVRGLMCMASNCDDQNIIKEEFTAIKELFNLIKHNYYRDISWFNTISAGMSGDYMMAIECGSNMIRVGSSIFK